jgi:hypothetical protein
VNIYYLSSKQEIASDKEGPENQEFWTAVEQHIIHTNLHLTDSDFEYKIPLQTLKGYFNAVSQLNKPDTCKFGADVNVTPFL